MLTIGTAPTRDRGLDDVDLRILEELRQDGRISNVALGRKIGMTASACSRRIARLRNRGVIKGFNVVLDHALLGLQIRALVLVSRTSSSSADQVARRLSQIDGVSSAFLATGEFDLVLDVLAPDMQAFSQVLLPAIGGAPGVSGVRSILVMDEL